MKRKLQVTLLISMLTVCSCLFFSFENKKFLCLQTDSSILAIYSGSSPCGNFAKQLLNISSSIECEYIAWTITFYENPVTHKPSSFKLRYGAKSFANGGTATYAEAKGNWIITSGTKTNTAAVVYQLNLENQHSLSFVRMDENIIHLLYSDKNLMIGDAGWSYTLNKVSN